MLAQGFHVGDEMRRRVVAQLAERQRAAGAALIENDDAVMVGVEIAPMVGRGAGARPAMQEHHRHAVGVAADLPIHLMQAIEIKQARGVRRDRRIKRGGAVRTGHGPS
jgi:hypothetical protein